MPFVQTAPWIVLGVALAVSVVTDLSSARILDVVTWPSLLALLALRLGAEGLGDAESGLLSGVVASVGLMALFALWARRGRMGWGDVKLVGVVGAAFGFPDALTALACIAIAGALQATVTLLWQTQTRDGAGKMPRRRAAKLHGAPKAKAAPARRHIPYALAIAVGCVCAAWAGWV